MSLSISGSSTSLTAQLLKSRRDAAEKTASGSTAGDTSTSASVSVDGSGAVPSAAMLSFLAQLSSGNGLGGSDGSGGTVGTLSVSDSTAAPAAGPHGAHRHGGGHDRAGALGNTDAAGTAGFPTAADDDPAASGLVAAFQKAMQALTASGGTSGDASLSTAAAGTGTDTSTTATVSSDGLMRAILQAQHAYGAQAEGDQEA